MSELIVPPTLAALLMAFTTCFQGRSWVSFEWLVLGWVQCHGRRTLTEVALASGAIGERHISVFHRFFSRASWTLDALGHVVFTLAVKWLPADRPVVVLGDDTLVRKTGKSIALASMHHDPLLSSARKPFASFGHVWVVATHRHHVATCNLCEASIFVACDGSSPEQLARLAEHATRSHLAGHEPRERAQYVLAQLPNLPPPMRVPALKEAYAGLGGEDRRGVYRIDEALGSAAVYVYRLWLNANRCGGPRCRHDG